MRTYIHSPHQNRPAIKSHNHVNLTVSADTPPIIFWFSFLPIRYCTYHITCFVFLDNIHNNISFDEINSD